MIARTTDDYTAMAAAGIVAVIEPAFWLGQPRTNVGSYTDYLSHIIGFERFRAGQFGIRHYCTVGLNPKEANNESLAEAVMAILPMFAGKEGVVAIGELGYDDQTALEDKYFRQQVELAKELDLPIMIHTPHRDKKAVRRGRWTYCTNTASTRPAASSTTITKRPCARCSTEATGLVSRSIQAPRWATRA